jgi:antitoxin HigA-1
LIVQGDDVVKAFERITRGLSEAIGHAKGQQRRGARAATVKIARKELKRGSVKGITTGKLEAVHPGSVLLADFIEPMGITRHRLAKAIGVQQRRIDEICAGERAITADTAVRLGLAFGIDPLFWLNLQAQYDIETTQRERGAQLAKTVQVLRT